MILCYPAVKWAIIEKGVGSQYEFLRCVLSRAWLIMVILILEGQFSEAQRVRRGKIDLHTWDIREEPVKTLPGTWAFYWGEQLQWKDIKKRPPDTFIEFAMPWNEQPVGGKKIPDKGIATYYAEVVLPRHSDSLAIQVPAVYSSYELWINDHKVSSNGKVGFDKTSYIPMWKPITCEIESLKDTLRFVFQVANFHHVRGGSIAPIAIGRADVLFKKEAAAMVSVKILFVSCLVLCLYCFLIFFTNKSASALYFAWFVITMSIRAMFSDPYLFHDYLHNVSWLMAVKIEYTTIPLLAISGILFINSMYPMEVAKAAKYFFSWMNVLFCIAIVFSSPEFFSKLLIGFQAAAVAEAIYCFYVISKAIINERIGSWLSCASIVIILLVALYNLMVYLVIFELNYFIINIGYLLSFILAAVTIFYRPASKVIAEGMLTYSDLYKREE